MAPIEEAKDSVVKSLPNTIKEPVGNAFGYVERLRTTTSEQISTEKINTKAKIGQLEAGNALSPKETQEDEIDTLVRKEAESKDQILSSAKAPLQYVWLFFLTVVGLVFQYKIVFYIVLILAIIGTVRLIIKLVR